MSEWEAHMREVVERVAREEREYRDLSRAVIPIYRITAERVRRGRWPATETMTTELLGWRVPQTAGLVKFTIREGEAINTTLICPTFPNDGFIPAASVGGGAEK